MRRHETLVDKQTGHVGLSLDVLAPGGEGPHAGPRLQGQAASRVVEPQPGLHVVARAPEVHVQVGLVVDAPRLRHQEGQVGRGEVAAEPSLVAQG